METVTHRCKGMRDMLPADMATFRRVERTFIRSCESWGYREIRTPVLEYLHLFTATGTLTPARLSQTYSFLDWDGWSGERVVLRPDSTIPAARLYVDNLGSLEQARLYYVQNIFTFESTGRENREKWQCGAEFIGGAGALADAEIILMARDVLKEMGVERVEVHVSHAGLIKALLGELEPDRSKQAELFDRILDGNTEGIRLENGAGAGLGKALNLVFNYSGRAEGFLKNLKATASASLPALGQPLDDFVSVVELLTPLDGEFKLDIASGRGFEYYTGIMVQFTSGGVRIGGGGRYDDLISLTGGRRMPACGYALYLDRLVNLVGPYVAPETPGTVSVVTHSGSVQQVNAGFDLCRQLRARGYVAVVRNVTDMTAPSADHVVTILDDGGRLRYRMTGTAKRSSQLFNSPEDLLRKLATRGQTGST